MSPPVAALSRYGPVALRLRGGVHERGSRLCAESWATGTAHAPAGRLVRRCRGSWLVRGTCPYRPRRTKASRPSRGRRARASTYFQAEVRKSLAHRRRARCLATDARVARGLSTHRGRALPDPRRVKHYEPFAYAPRSESRTRSRPPARRRRPTHRVPARSRTRDRRRCPAPSRRRGQRAACPRR